MVSFDIFDTLITRKTYNPAGVFAIAAEQVLSKCRSEKFYYEEIVRDFVSLRISAERNARRRCLILGKKETTLNCIYGVIKEATFINEEIISQIQEAEIRAEINCAMAIRKNVEVLKKHIHSGEKVVLISDMYLPQKVIEEILKKAAPEIAHLPVYVSSETGCVKSDGSLFSYVRDCENADYGLWEHYGDDMQSDKTVPRMLGINVGEIYLPVHSSYLDYYANKTEQYNPNIQISLGVMKQLVGYADYLSEDLTKNKWGGYIAGVAIGGPLFFGYVKWILDDCIDGGISDIYFLSRDGYILKKVADIIISHNELKIKTHYLYSSRTAWQTTDCEVLVKYAEQQIDLSNGVALVDIQGTGRTVDCFVKAVRTKYRKFNPFVYYYSYDFSDYKPDYNLKSYSFEKEDYLLEILSRAPEDRTKGFEALDGNIVPVFEQSGIVWKETGIESYIKGVCGYTECLLKAEKTFGFELKGNKLEEIIKDYVLNVSDKDIDDFLGDMPFDFSDSEGIQRYATPITSDQAEEIFLLGNQDLIGGVKRKVALRRSSEMVRKRVSDYLDPTYKLSEHEMQVLNSFINEHIDLKRNAESRNCLLYGAGEYGRTFYRLLNDSSNYHVVAWTDMNYERLREQGMPLVSVEEALNMSYELIVIAIKDKTTAENVRGMLSRVSELDCKIMFAENLLHNTFSDPNERVMVT